MENKSPKAFTLVELMVVIGIIAALLSILMPSLSMLRKQVFRFYCLSNLSQLSLGWQMYNTDNDGRLPSPYTLKADVLSDNRWVADGNNIDYNDFENSQQAIKAGVLFGYVTNPQVYQCRAGSRSRGYCMSYTTGGAGPGHQIRDGIIPFDRFGEIAKPGSRLLFADAQSDYRWPFGPYWPVQLKQGQYLFAPFEKTGGQYMTARHSRGCNFAFADLHAGYYRYRSRKTLNMLEQRPGKHSGLLGPGPGKGLNRSSINGTESREYYSRDNRDLLTLLGWLKGKTSPESHPKTP